MNGSSDTRYQGKFHCWDRIWLVVKKHLETYASQWEGLSHILWKRKKCLKPPTRDIPKQTPNILRPIDPNSSIISNHQAPVYPKVTSQRAPCWVQWISARTPGFLHAFLTRNGNPQASGHVLGISWGFHGDTMGIQCWGCATNGPTKFFTICGLAGAKPTCSRQIPSKKHRPLLMISWKPQLAPVNRWKPQMRPTRIDTWRNWNHCGCGPFRTRLLWITTELEPKLAWTKNLKQWYTLFDIKWHLR